MVAGVLHAHERADDVVHIAAAAEVFSGASQHDRAHLAHALKGDEGVGEFTIRVERERILSLGPVECDGGDAIAHAPPEVLRRDARR